VSQSARPSSLLATLVAPLALALVLAACASPGTSPATSPASSPNGSPGAPTPSTAAPSAVPSPTEITSGDVIVTIEVADGERYRILLTDSDDIAIARDLLAGREAPSIPNGRVIRGDPGVNVGYSWQIDPSAFEWADVTTEVCDGTPADVEAGRISGDRFCPWSAKVVAIENAPGSPEPSAAG
jgi:hypothetical protein